MEDRPYRVTASVWRERHGATEDNIIRKQRDGCVDVSRFDGSPERMHDLTFE
jgi:hypothetical protein